MRPGARGHLFCSVLQFPQWCNLLPDVRDEKDINCDGGESIPIKENERKNRVIFEVKVVPLYYTQEVRSMMCGNFSRSAHYAIFCEETVSFRRKWSLYENVLYHVAYKNRGTVLTTHPWYKNEISGILWLSRTDNL